VKEIRKAYRMSDRGKQVRKKYENSDKYKETRRKYLQSEKYKQAKREYYLRNKEKILKRNKKRRESKDGRRRYTDTSLKMNYNISIDEYEKLYNEQSGVCAICKKPEIRVLNGRPLRLGVDHDHVTGKIRGLLCSSCNTALGLLKEDPSIFISALEYLGYKVLGVRSVRSKLCEG